MKIDTQCRQQGVIIPFLALLVVALLACLILAIDGSHYAAQDASLKSVVDMTASSAMDVYKKNPIDPNAGFDEAARRQLTLDAANHIAQQHRLATSASELGNLSLNPANPGDGEIRFGTYYPTRDSANGTGGACDTTFSQAADYPCWEESTSATEPAGSIYVKMRTRANNPVQGFISASSVNLESDSVATVVETCVASALDVSESTTNRDHFGYRGGCINSDDDAYNFFDKCNYAPLYFGFFFDNDNDPTNGINHPDYRYPGNELNQNPIFISRPTTGQPIPLSGDSYETPLASNYVLSFNSIFPGAFGGVGTTATMVNCSSYTDIFNSGINTGTLDARTWCSMHVSRDAWMIEHPNANPPQGMAFWTDYGWNTNTDSVQAIRTGGAVSNQTYHLVNRFKVPQPLSTFLQTTNSNARFQFSTGTGHSGLLFGFTGAVLNRAFPLPDAAGNMLLDTDLGFLSQLSHTNFAGQVSARGNVVVPQTNPNFLDWRLFPDTTNSSQLFSSTNVVLALHEAQKALVNTNQTTSRCGNRAAKYINLMTDGISTCTYFDPATFSPGLPSINDCSSTFSGWEHYVHSERMIMGEMADYLADQQIPVNVFLSLRGVHYLNRKLPGAAPGCENDNSDDNCFATPYNAAQYGLGSHQAPSANGAPPPYFAALPCTDPVSDPQAFYDCRSRNPDLSLNGNDQFVFDQVNQGDLSYYFLRPLAAFHQLSARTGGTFCPLFPLDLGWLSSYVDHDGDSHASGGACPPYPNAGNCCRDAALNGYGTPCILANQARTGLFEVRPPILALEAGQAFYCLTKSLGLSSIVVKKPRNVICPTC